MKRHLAGQVAIVTGSSLGIGRAVAMEVARQGARVLVNGRQHAGGEPDALGEVVAEIEAAGGRALACHASVASFEEVGELVAICRRNLGEVDILINCAGIAEPEGASILNTAAADWQALLDVHLTGTFNTCRHVAETMAARRHGCIVNTSSHAALGVFGGTGYAAAKGGVQSLSLAIARELREYGVRCNVICPGARTRLSSGPEYERKIDDLQARGLLSEAMAAGARNPPGPEWVAPLYAFLASPLADGVTGCIFSAAGGYVGRFDGAGERMLAYRDPERAGRWTLEALAESLPPDGLGV